MGGLPWWLSGKEPACQCRRRGFNPWVEKIPLATRNPVDSLASYRPWDCKKVRYNLVTKQQHNNGYRIGPQIGFLIFKMQKITNYLAYSSQTYSKIFLLGNTEIHKTPQIPNQILQNKDK